METKSDQHQAPAVGLAGAILYFELQHTECLVEAQVITEP